MISSRAPVGDRAEPSGRASPGARPLEAGDPAPHVVALDETGERTFSNADLVTGRPLVLLFCSSGGEPPTALLAAFRDRGAAFASLEANIYAVSRLPMEANRAAHAALQLPFRLLTDSTGDIFRAYGAD